MIRTSIPMATSTAAGPPCSRFARSPSSEERAWAGTAAELVNAAIDAFIRERCELPSLSTLLKACGQCPPAICDTHDPAD
jgi:hypothetical protein